MKLNKIIAPIFFLCMLLNTVPVFSQEPRPEFTAEWKADSIKHTVIVKAPEVSTPYKVIIYDAAPFEGGTVLEKTEVIINQTTEIDLAKKKRVCVCVVKDAINFNCKWLDVK